jgi:hypothetical protein
MGSKYSREVLCLSHALLNHVDLLLGYVLDFGSAISVSQLYNPLQVTVSKAPKFALTQ